VASSFGSGARRRLLLDGILHRGYSCPSAVLRAAYLPLIRAALMMVTGGYLHFTEAHDQEYLHQPVEHEHGYVHDVHTNTNMPRTIRLQSLIATFIGTQGASQASPLSRPSSQPRARVSRNLNPGRFGLFGWVLLLKPDQ
jgi:hypothetical protein